MRLLDTREQKSPRFLMDAFPDITISILKSGDYLSAEKVVNRTVMHPNTGKMENIYELYGNLVEIKIGTDFGIHTEQLERFQDELYRMRLWQKENPKVDLHAIWLIKGGGLREVRLFHRLCHSYHVWGHVVPDEGIMIKVLKGLDNPSAYVRDRCFIKRDHVLSTVEAKRWRQIDGVSSTLAEKLAKRKHLSCGSNLFNSQLYYKAERDLKDVIGLKKGGQPKRLYYRIRFVLKYGTNPEKDELDEFIRYLEEGD